ncbi:MAG: hypothetical protein IKM30_01080 [Oscillospiraceae bacterium]|nr:hypothetical protein [Oscillospiraceae bacterium]
MVHPIRAQDALPKQTLLVAGGDLRQLSAARHLAAHHHVTVTGFDAVSDLPLLPTNPAPSSVDALILPMPVTQDGVFLHTPLCSSTIGLSSLLPLVKPGGAVFGGRWTPADQRAVEAAGRKPLDYSAREEFAIQNAVPTAEGALQLALQELPVTIHGLSCLILGAGRISRVLQPILRAMGAEVTVAARRCSDLAWSKVPMRKPRFPIKNSIPSSACSAENGCCFVHFIPHARIAERAAARPEDIAPRQSM